jgi:hypothetical protein
VFFYLYGCTHAHQFCLSISQTLDDFFRGEIKRISLFCLFLVYEIGSSFLGSVMWGAFANLGSWERIQVRLFISISFIFGKKADGR